MSATSQAERTGRIQSGPRAGSWNRQSALLAVVDDARQSENRFAPALERIPYGKGMDWSALLCRRWSYAPGWPNTKSLGEATREPARRHTFRGMGWQRPGGCAGKTGNTDVTMIWKSDEKPRLVEDHELIDWSASRRK